MAGRVNRQTALLAVVLLAGVLALAYVLLWTGLAAWALQPLAPDCPDGYAWNWWHRRCAGNLEFDTGGGGPFH